MKGKRMWNSRTRNGKDVKGVEERERTGGRI